METVCFQTAAYGIVGYIESFGLEKKWPKAQ